MIAQDWALFALLHLERREQTRTHDKRKIVETPLLVV